MFEPDRLYPTDSPELLELFSASTLAQWRFEKRGPAWHKFGKRVFYSGKDLNAFIALRRRETDDSRLAEAAA